MDEQRLREIQRRSLAEFFEGKPEQGVDREAVFRFKNHKEASAAIILIRMGLWAREDAIPALRWIDSPEHYHKEDGYTQTACFQHRATNALGKLPKGER